MNSGFFQVWIDALTKPTEENYVAITEAPGVSFSTAAIWIFLTSTISFALSAGERLLFGGTGADLAQMFGRGGDSFSGAAGRSPYLLLCFAPLVGVFAIIGLAIGTGLTQWIAGMLGGKGTFNKLAYAVAAFSAPFSLISGLIGGIPIVGFCLAPVSLYLIFLQVLAVKAVNRLDWGKAAIAALVVPFLLILVCCCLGFAAGAVLGPALGNVFSQINSGLVP